jgi:hypothetical protein
MLVEILIFDKIKKKKIYLTSLIMNALKAYQNFSGSYMKNLKQYFVFGFHDSFKRV